jgi:hypothetical protein
LTNRDDAFKLQNLRVKKLEGWMPNCDWYGTLEDHRILLEHVFQQDDLSVWELASDNGPLRRFDSVDDVVSEFDRPHTVGGRERSSVHLMLYVEGSCVRGFVPRKKHGREFADGFGMLQFYLERPSRMSSHTNHNSRKRAEKWDQLIEEDSAEDWDFELVTRTSSSLNRFIRKCGEEKLGSRVLLPGAAALWHAGEADFFC